MSDAGGLIQKGVCQQNGGRPSRDFYNEGVDSGTRHESLAFQ